MARIKTQLCGLATLICACLMAGCSSTPTSKTDTSAQSTEAQAPLSRTTPVVAGRPARMYIWAGFSPEDCTAITPTLTIAQPPKKGTISFRPNQTTKIKQSTSGKCIGHNVYGTGIYYTARNGQTGPDQFSITASTPGDLPVTRTFSLIIAN